MIRALNLVLSALPCLFVLVVRIRRIVGCVRVVRCDGYQEVFGTGCDGCSSKNE